MLLSQFFLQAQRLAHVRAEPPPDTPGGAAVEEWAWHARVTVTAPSKLPARHRKNYRHRTQFEIELLASERRYAHLALRAVSHAPVEDGSWERSHLELDAALLSALQVTEGSS